MNEQAIRQWYGIMKEPNQLVEIRILDGKKTYSGYFKDVESIISAIRPYEHCGIYAVLNSIDEACYSRAQRDRLVLNPKSTTNDNNIIGRDIIMIDFDPKRASDTNSSDEEKEYAKQVVNKVYKFLRDMGFSSPIIADSCNGWHAYYRIAMKNSEENTQLIKDFLNVLNMMFGDDKVDIDCSTYNASRIAKLIGTSSSKGSDTVERPRRESMFIRIPDEFKITENEYIQKVADMLPKPETPNRANNFSSEKFDLDAFIEKYNIKIHSKSKSNGVTKYVLEECAFDSNHKHPDAAIFVLDNGAIGYKCLHNSCQQYTFKDFRLLFDPNAYNKTYSSNLYRDFRKNPIKEFTPIVETKEKGETWIKMSQIEKYKIDPNNFIPSGIEQLDKLIIGFKRKHVSVWSGYRGCAKSTLLNELILNAANKGYKTALWTGELDNTEVKTWLYLQAAGKQFNKQSQFNNFYYTPDNICKKIDSWIDKYFCLFNNEYGDNFYQIEYEVKKLKEQLDIDVLILDNLMCLDIDDIDGDKYDKQKQLMKKLTKLAKELNIHIHLVAHPNKSGTFLRPNNISGSGHIPDLAQNVFIIHRIGQDFANDSKDFLSPITRSDIINSGCTNIVEICKCREKGAAVDHFIKLWFEKESNRLKDNIGEHIVYGWEESPKPIPLMQNREPEIDDMSDYQQYYYDDDNVFKERDTCPF